MQSILTEEGISVRRNISRTLSFDDDGTPYGVVNDWLGRGREHPGFRFGRHAAGLLDLIDGRALEQVLEDAQTRLGERFQAANLDKVISSLEQQQLLNTEETRKWIAALRDLELSSGRRAAIADNDWYPQDAAKLKTTLAALLNRAREGSAQADHGQPRAIIAPHAAFDGSGQCAAAAFASLWDVDPPETVVVLGPNHCYSVDEVDVATVPFETALGSIQPNPSFVEELTDDLSDRAGSLSHNGLAQFRDHSLEMQLPILQYIARERWKNEPTIVPILLSITPGRDGVAAPRRAELRQLGAALADLLTDSRTLLIVSGDLTHYGAPFGFTPFEDGETNEQIEALDREILDSLTALDGDQMLDQVVKTTWCGGPSFYVLAETARRLSLDPVLLRYQLAPEQEWREQRCTTSFAALSFSA